MEIEFMFFMS